MEQYELSNFEKGERMNGIALEKKFNLKGERVRITFHDGESITGKITEFTVNIIKVETNNPQPILLNTDYIISIKKLDY